MLIPSIDLMGGKAVQLVHGKEKVLERDDVWELAKEFSKYGEIAVIDLDAALGKGNNVELIKKLCRTYDCRVGGGIRTIGQANEFLKAGARKVIIGTKATPAFLRNLPKERVIVAVDTKNDNVVTGGWTSETGKSPGEIMKETENYCSEFLFTKVNNEGMMKGCDLKTTTKLKRITKNKLTAAGGITTEEEIRQLEDMGVNSQLGMAIYTGKIKLDETFVSLLDFKKNKGLVPTIVQDDKNRVLMLAFSSRESLLKTFRTGKATYYSRSRNAIWTKGETSSNFQEFVKARYDCDRDALLFTVKQKNVACHQGSYSCFGDNDFALEELYAVVKDRVDNPRKDSYTSKIAVNEKLIMEKIMEEAGEITDYKNRDNLVWEIADLAYFLMVLMTRNDITMKDIRNELWRRRK